MDSRAKRRKREEEDDDMILFLFPAVHLLDSGGGGERKHLGMHQPRLVLEGHVMNCLVAYRMEPEVFKSTAEFLRRKNLVRDTRGVRVEEKLAMFMYMLSHNASYQDMQYKFKHSGATIHLHIRAFFDIVPTLTHRFIKPPLANQTHSKITSNPRFYPYFKVQY